jgi:hypothetical protein
MYQLRPVDQRLVELRVLARRIAEHVFHARGDQLFGEGRAARAPGLTPATGAAGAAGTVAAGAARRRPARQRGGACSGLTVFTEASTDCAAVAVRPALVKPPTN